MESLLNFLLNFYGPAPYFFVFGILLLCGLGLPIPEDITLFVGGMLSYYGVTDVWTMIAVCFIGVLFGDSIIFALGSHYGRRMAQRWPFSRLLTPQRLAEVRTKFHDRGNKLIFAARFMPGLRAPIFFSAGTLHLPFRVFFFYDGLAALISVPTIIGAVYYFGDEVDHVIRVIQRIEHGIAFVLLGIVLLFGLKWYINRRKRA
jgi:membrane protein DedA with SNARE-associated domain